MIIALESYFIDNTYGRAGRECREKGKFRVNISNIPQMKEHLSAISKVPRSI